MSEQQIQSWLDYELAATISSNKPKNLQNNKNLKEDLKSKILAGQNISTYDPLNLHKDNTSLETGLQEMPNFTLHETPIICSRLATTSDKFW